MENWKTPTNKQQIPSITYFFIGIFPEMENGKIGKNGKRYN